MMIRFIKATPQDRPIIEKLARQTWPATFKGLLPAEQIEYMLNLYYNQKALLEQMNADQPFLLVQYDGEYIGFTSYELNYLQEAQLMIHKIYLLPSAQGKGIGKASFDHLTQIALQHQQKALTLKVYHQNTAAIAFYLKNGFTKVGTDIKHIGEAYKALDFVMRKEL